MQVSNILDDVDSDKEIFILEKWCQNRNAILCYFIALDSFEVRNDSLDQCQFYCWRGILSTVFRSFLEILEQSSIALLFW